MKTQTSSSPGSVKPATKTSAAARSSYKTPFKAEEDKATKMVRTYLTPGENRQFEENYKLAKIGQKMSRSKFIKIRIVANENAGTIGTKKQRAKTKKQELLITQIQLNKLDELITELKHIGVNYNQSTRRLNQFQLPGDIQKESIGNKNLELEILGLVEKLNTLYLDIEKHFTAEED